MRKKSLIISISAIIGFISILINFNDIRTIAIVNVLSLIIFAYLIQRKQNKIFSPFFAIMVCLYIFHSGHLWLCLFESNPIQFILEEGYGNGEYDVIEMYRRITILLIVFSAIGFIIVKPAIPQHNNISISFSNVVHAFTLGIWLLCMYFEVRRASSVSTLGYGEGYHYANSIESIISDCTNTLLIVMIYAYRNNKTIMWRYVALLLIRALFIMFFVGNRGSSVIYFILAVFLISNFSYLSNNKSVLKKIYLGSAIFLLVAMPLISLTRGHQVGGIAELQNSGVFFSFLEEFGGTAMTAFLANDFVNYSSTFNGLQILATSLTILPGSTLLFGDVISEYASIGTLLNEFNGMNGLGGSMIAQLVLNFGNSVWLYISMGLMSVFVAWISNNLMSKDVSVYKNLICLCLFSGLLANVRGEWYDTVSQLKLSLYCCIFIYILHGQICHISYDNNR